MAGWPANLARVRVLVGGVPAVVRGYVGAVDARWSAGMAGRTGTIRAGAPYDPSMRSTAYLAYQATARIPEAAASTLRRGPQIALPSTTGDVRYLSPAGRRVLDTLAGTAPGGLR